MIFVRQHRRGNFLVRAFQRKGSAKERINRALAKTVNSMNIAVQGKSKGRNRGATLAVRYRRLETMLHA